MDPNVYNLEPFFNTIDTLVSVTEQHRLTWQEDRAAMSPEYWLRNMSTLDLVLPRRIGKTSYINDRAKSDDLVILHNHAMKNPYEDSPALVVTPSEIERLLGRGVAARHAFNRVYVDEPHMVFNEHYTSEIFSRDKFYLLFGGIYSSRVSTGMVIMLGT